MRTQLEELKKYGYEIYIFAWELGAKRYKSVAQWFNRMWCKEDFYKL